MVSKIFYLTPSLILLLSILNCQVSESEAIIKGEKAQPGEFPSIVSLRNETGKHYCGGTLVTRKHVVTAAHCLYEDNSVFTVQALPVMLKPENIKVVAGSLSVAQGGDTYEVERFTVHPQYDIYAVLYYNYDVAVIVLKEAVNTKNVAPTSISTVIPKGEFLGKVGGWGLLSFNESNFMHQNDFPTDLQKLSVTIQDKAMCREKYIANPWSVKQIDTGYVICAQPLVDKSGTCVRDSGSPLMVGGEFVGLAVMGIPCAHGKPDFYAPTAIYNDFIMQEVNLIA